MSRSWTNADDIRPVVPPMAPPADDDPAACLRGFRGLLWGALLVVPLWGVLLLILFVLYALRVGP